MKQFLLIGFLVLPSLLLAQAPTLTFNPINNATNISVSANLMISSDVALSTNGTNLNDTNVDALITLVDGLSNSIPFDATVDGPRRVITINPTSNLSELTTYTLTIQPVENASGDKTSVESITFTTGDFTDPVINFARAVDNTGAGFTFLANVNENATVYYVVDASSSVPSRADIVAGKNGGGTPAAKSGSISVTAGNTGSASITGLPFGPTKYFVYYFAQDGSANQSGVDTRGIPVLTSSSMQNLQAFQFDLRVNIDESATTYYVVTQSATAPTATQILAGQDETGAAANAAGNFSVNANTNTNKTISGLDDGTTYHVYFVATDGSGNQTVVGTQTTTTLDGTPPSVTALTPADGSSTVDISTNTFTITFDENIITSASGASGGSDLVKLFEEGVMKESITRGDVNVATNGSIVISGSTVTITFVYALKPKKNYYITIGDDVFSDAAGNDFPGYGANTDWNFTTSGVTVNNLSSSICSGSFQSIANIVISETGMADFNTGSSQELTLSLANTSEFVISNSGVLVSGSSADVSGLSVTVGLTSLTVTYSVSGGTVLDNITISGLKIYATGAVTSTTIIRTGGNGDMDGGNGTGGSSLTYATINVGANPPSQTQLAASQDLVHCDGEDITAKTLTVVNQGAVTYDWYTDASLSTLVKSTSSTTVNLVSDLGMASPAVVGTHSYYVVTVGACQSSPALQVDIKVGANPVANAGTDKTGINAVCPDTELTLGGNPTLQTPSAAGTYTYTWEYVEGTPEPLAQANPTYTVDNLSTTATATYNFQVTVTDANGCAGTDILTVDVKPTFSISLTSPNASVFSPNSPNQALNATPAGGVFSGVGVIQSAANSYEFSPQAANASDANPLPKSFTVYYTVTQGGCTKENAPIATFTISNSFFSTLQPEYCSNEYPNPSGTVGVKLSIDTDGYNYVETQKNNWNSTRFSRVTYTDWASLSSYSYNTFVRYSGELYRCNNSSGCGGLFNLTPPSSDANWTVALIVKFDGLIANYYETAYGGNATPTIVKSAETYTVGTTPFNFYRFGTNENYINCPTCNYAYPAAYIEFEQPEDVRIFMPAWFSANYSVGSVVRYGDRIYKKTSAVTDFNPPAGNAAWTDVTDSDYGNGQYIHFRETETSPFRSGFYVIGQYVQINRNPTVFFSGLKDSQTVCEFEVLDLDNENSSDRNLYQLTGNYANTAFSQKFEVKLDGASSLDFGNGTIENSISSPGTADFDTKAAFTNSPGGGSTAKNIQIVYSVDPGTKGSTAQACYGTSSIIVQVRKNSAFEFANSVAPEGSIYCYTEAAKSIGCTYNGSPVNGAAGSPNSVTYSGFGVNDLGNSASTFTPGLAIQQFVPGTTGQQSFPVTAVYRDVNQCLSMRARTFKVNPDIQPSFSFSGRQNYCYEDVPNNFAGHAETFTVNAAGVSSSGKYYFDYTDPGASLHHLDTVLSNNTSFLAGVYYDQIQGVLTSGNFTSNLNQAVNLNVIYTETLNTSDTVCSETFTKTMVINPPITLDIFGLANGDILCRNDNSNVSAGNLVSFDGSVTGSGIFRLDDDNDFSAVNPTLNSTVNTSSGKATINLLSAYNAASDPSDPRHVFLQYQYTGAGCTGPADVIKDFEISPPPALSFDFGASPANGEIFCYDEAPVQLSTVQNTNVSLSGYGITDSGTGNGSGTFSPNLAYNTSVTNGGTLNTPQTIPVTARIVDGYGCVNLNTINYTVNPIPQAALNTGSLDYCYEDPARTLQGQQAKSWFKIVYQGVVTPHTDNSLGDISSPMSSISFDPKARFNDAVINYGASALTPVKFDVYYSVADNNSCTNTIGPYTVTVANQIEVKIAGMDDDDIFCSNEDQGVKVLSFNPFPADASKRIFSIDGQTVPLSSDKYNFNAGLAGGDFELRYVVISGNNCTNTDTLKVKVLPSPMSVFNVQPHCDGDLIDFNADGTNNLSSAVYTWTLSDSVRTGQNLQHRFPGVSTYSVQLHVAYPAYNNDPALVCQDSLRLDQIVGPVPKMSLSFFNVCESDNTSFVAQPDIPISTVSWDFGDSESTGFGFQADNIPPTATTSGKYGAPLHKYAGAGNYNVIVTGKTAPVFGGCVDSDTVDVAILKNWAPSATDPAYDMSLLDGGKGFWVKEDVNGNSTWEFNAPAKQHINTSEMAWVTGAAEPYKAGDASYVNSPCFDLSGFSRPVISIKHWTDTELSDGAVMQYSIDGGKTWERLGNVASGLEWYNELTISSNPGDQQNLTSGWSVRDQHQWAIGKHTLDVLPSPRNQVRLRIAFASFKNTTGMDGFAFNDVVIEERNRTVLAENFSNLSAVNNNTAFRYFRDSNGDGIFNTDELVKLEYHHASGPTPDALNQANPIDQNARAAFYGVTSPTRAFIDGGFGQNSTNSTFEAGAALDTYFSLRSLVTAPVNISIDFLPEPSDKLNVKATVQATSDVGSPGQYNVFIAVAEQQVLGQIYVLRKLLPDASGTPLTSLSAADPAQEIIASYDMRHVTRLANGDYAPFAVVVFVQNLETKEVLQTAIRQDGTASSNIVTGIETAGDQDIKLYPNPADDRLSIILPAPVKAETPISIFDTFGKQVYKGVFRAGENVKEVETKPLSGGVYLIQLSTPRGIVRKKAMVVHN